MTAISGYAELIETEMVQGDQVAHVAKQIRENADRLLSLTCARAPAVLSADRDLLKELMESLIQNAIQYNRENGTILVSCGQENGHPFFSVRDSGIGIPENQQQRIFERFYRVDKSRSRQTGGTGLGLAIVKHIAEIHDAKIILDSEPGEGTCITVRFYKKHDRSTDRSKAKAEPPTCRSGARFINPIAVPPQKQHSHP